MNFVARLSVLVCVVFATPGLAAEPAENAKSLPRLTVATTRFGGMDLVTLDVEGQNAVRETSDPAGAVGPTWAPDGRRLAFTSYRAGRGQIFVRDEQGKETNLTNSKAHERNANWSSDGKQIVFDSDRGGAVNVWAMAADGSNPRNLTAAKNFNSDASWSPDGKRIAFVSGRAGGNRVWLMNADGSGQAMLIDETQVGALYPAWSADGRQVVFGDWTNNGTVQLSAMNLDGSARQTLTSGDKSQSYAAWSPDGQYIAYIRFDRWPEGLDPTVRPDPNLPGGDLVIYDTVTDEHTTISTGDVCMWGPRPAWKPMAAQAGVK